jgi:hypothetical protein
MPLVSLTEKSNLELTGASDTIKVNLLALLFNPSSEWCPQAPFCK